MKLTAAACFAIMLAWLESCTPAVSPSEMKKAFIADSRFKLIPSGNFLFNSFVDCNMATGWVKDTFRIFPGKYGEDPLWGEAHELNYTNGSTGDEGFLKPKLLLNKPGHTQKDEK